MTNAKTNKIIAGIATIIVHAIVVLLLFILCFRTPLPLPGEAGVEVNLGMYADVISHQITEIPPQQKIEEVVEEVVEEEILSEDEELPAIEEVKHQDSVAPDQQEAEEVIEEKPVINQRAMFKVTTTEQNVTDSEVQDIKEYGAPNGLKDMDRYEGNGGSGGGPAYDLGGRGAKSIPSPSKDFEEEGKVVVDIWVDKEGTVQRAEIGKGTTVTNSSMRESARQAALKALFVQDKNASDIQKGTITYTFIIRQ